jgi:hypothetical protein
MVETPFMWFLLAIMTALLALVARRIADQRPREPVA